MDIQLKNLIKSLSEINFKDLIVYYCKTRFNADNVRIIDGPYDGGNDLEIIKGDVDIKRNIQVTINKSYEHKLEADLCKISELATRNNQLDFFISQELSKTKRESLETNAILNHNITLKIYDANILAQEPINGLRERVYKYHNIDTNISVDIDKNTKILFDVLTLGKKSVEAKKNFFTSLVLSSIYNNPHIKYLQLAELIKPQLKNKIDDDYLKKEINALKQKQIVLSPTTDKWEFYLSDNKQQEINEIYQQCNLLEKILLRDVHNFIEANAIPCSESDLCNAIKSLYYENYKITVEDLTKSNESTIYSVKKTYADLVNFFTKKGCSNEDSNRFAEGILRVVSKNEYLNKIAAATLFTNLYNDDKLQSYINNQNKSILLDTQVLIRLLCVIYDEDFDYDDTAIRAVGILHHTLNKFKQNTSIYTSREYISEVAAHIQEALKLQRFLDLPYKEMFGRSKNVFYNAYISLLNAEKINENWTLEDFICDLIAVEKKIFPSYQEPYFIPYIIDKLSFIYEHSDLQIEIKENSSFSNFQQIKKEYEIMLLSTKRNRTNLAIENDVKAILLLHEDYQINNWTPFIVSWDFAFLDIRKRLKENLNYKNYSCWYAFSPLKMVDRLSIMNYSINPSSISLDLIALAENNFNYTTRTASFFDVISSFFNDKDVKNHTVIKKLAQLNQDLAPVTTDQETNFEEESPFVKMLLDIQDYYSNNHPKYSIDNLVVTFENNAVEDNLIQIFRQYLIDNSLNKEQLFMSIDALIERTI